MGARLAEITDWAEGAAAAQWSISAMAQDCGVSVAQLERHFLETLGQTPRAKLHAERMARACEWLELGKRVYEVAMLLHYARPQNFTRAFTAHFGYSPSEYLARNPNSELRTPNSELRTPNSELRTPNLEPRTSNLEPRTSNLEPRMERHARLVRGKKI